MSEDSFPFEILPTEEVARLLPNYSKISFLAQGGMAAVYRGVQTTLDRPVAIKLLPREFGSSESFRLRFEAEGKAMARLNHPNLVSIFDFGEVEGLLYLVMEFVEGETLHQRSHHSQLEDLEAVDLCLKVAEGLAHAHEHGILHRDIKPANVLLDSRGIPKLGDFGLAEDENRVEGDDLVFGTPGYTSPEVMANPESADERADIFAIGILLYEMLTGSIPAEPYTPPSRLVQSDSRIDALISKAIQPHPDQRYQKASKLADSLRDLRDKIKNSPRRKLATGTASANSSTTLKVQKGEQRALVVQPPKETSSLTPVLATGDNSDAREAPTPTSRPVKAGFDFAFLRNLIIIALLSVAIYGAWQALETRKETVAKEDAKNLEKEERKKRLAEAERKRAEVERIRAMEANGGTPIAKNPSLPNNGTAEPTSKNPKPQTEPEPLPPLEQLAALKNELVAGKREQLPEGTLQRSGSHFFFIEQALTWYEAIEFAESYGGHLAIVPSQSDVRWLSSEIPAEKDIWIGAGATSRSDWAWLDPEVSFSHRKPNTSTGIAGMLDSIGILKARHPQLKLPFFIQWDEEGKASPTRDSALQSLTGTLESTTPSWPPGTLFYQERRYLVLARSISQGEASQLAKKFGGTLAVASDELEGSFLQDVAEEAGLETLWIGGELRNGSWSWKTNEPWEFARWKEGYPIDDADSKALLIDQEGWLNGNTYQDASGLIIEWSNDAKDAPPVPDTEESSIGELDSLRAQAQRLLAKEVETSTKRNKDNFLAQGMSLRQWLRGFPKEEHSTYEEAYLNYTSGLDESTSRLPDPTSSALSSFSPKVAEILNRHFEQQSKDDEKLYDSAEKIRVSYLRKLVGMHAEAKAKGLISKAAPLQQEIDAIGTNGQSFLGSFGFVLTQKDAPGKDPQGFNLIHATYGVIGDRTNVTSIVQDLLQNQGRFLVNFKNLKASQSEPTITLRLICKVAGKRRALNFTEGQEVSIETIKLKASQSTSSPK